MAKKELIKDGFGFARDYTCSLFEQFKTTDEWVHQVHEKANHALWCAGHIANTDNFALTILAPDRVRNLDGYQELFGGGSQPTGDASKYPKPEEVLAYLKERRETLLNVLDAMSEDDLGKPTSDEAPEFMPTVESVFRILIWHEGLHTGQASIAHRGLGRAPALG